MRGPRAARPSALSDEAEVSVTGASHAFSAVAAGCRCSADTAETSLVVGQMLPARRLHGQVVSSKTQQRLVFCDGWGGSCAGGVARFLLFGVQLAREESRLAGGM